MFPYLMVAPFYTLNMTAERPTEIRIIYHTGLNPSYLFEAIPRDFGAEIHTVLGDRKVTVTNGMIVVKNEVQ